jgi:nitronate monooxygenase
MPTLADVAPIAPDPAPLAPLDRRAIEAVLASSRRLLVQGGMGIHASDGLAGKVARHRGERLVGVGTISGVVKTDEQLRGEIRRARREAPGGFVGVNLMAAIDRRDFARLAAVALEERVSFVVQGAGISREIVRWCRDAGVPFAGIVSSGRLAAMYEKWGAEFLVAEGAEAGGHIGDVGHSLPALLAEVRGASALPVIAAGGVSGADVGFYLEAGAAGVQLATRFLACSDGDAHPVFKDMHLGKGDQDVVLITSCVKGMQARAVRNEFTERLARGEAVPPRSKAWYFGREGYAGRRKACIECLAVGVCKCRASGFRESFCITDALLLAAVKGDRERGLFYSGQSVTRIGDTEAGALPSAADLLRGLEERLAAEAGESRRTAAGA